ncbi:pentatricopeptide repeat-containing protein At3g63370, chloroplastic isoform X2 [Momordica charantia]|nr:pentatricopeptide repeat-containing protein At3g63370, chloroplastic isoform X2 [Momordica charantia]
MSERTIFTWNGMIGAYVSVGEPMKALELYRNMRLLGIPLDSCTFPCVLKACGMLKNPYSGTEIHCLAIKLGYDSVVFVLNSLVAMYAKCNNLHNARCLFRGMNGNGDSVSWNSMISAYSANGLSVEALTLFREMQVAPHVTNNPYTYVSVLQACEDSHFLKQGMEIHGSVLKSYHYADIFVLNALIGMYVRCGKLKEAVAAFSRMDEKDCFSWNTILSGFVQYGHYDEALLFFHDMQDPGKKFDQVAILNVIAACGRLGKLMNGREVHAYAIKHGLDSDLQVGNTLVDMYGRCCCVKIMGHVFDEIPDKDFISWTTVIAGYSLNNEHVSAIELFKKALIEGIDVDTMMVGSILSSCIGLKCLSFVKEIHCYIERRSLFDQVLQNALVDAYGGLGNVDYARHMFESIDSKDVVSWTSMISCYVRNRLPNEALEHFNCMKKSNIEPDFVSLVSILSAAASLSSLKKGKEIHGYLMRKGFAIFGSVASSLVDMYSRCGNIEIAERVFHGIKCKDLILWTTMINANGMHGRGKAAIDAFNEMVWKFSPDHITFLSLLNACSHSGLIDEGRKFLRVMKSEYQLEPWTEHYVSVVDLLARANCLEEAYRFVESTKITLSGEAWCSLLRASWIHGNKELAQVAAQKLLELDLEPGNYVLVSNVFATCGRWKEVDDVRMKMRRTGLKKSPGCSWVEVGSEVQTFVARDRSHPQSDEIYQKLEMITKKLEKEGGYVPQTKLVVHNVDEEEKVQMLYAHSERLAIAFGLLKTPERTAIRVTKNLRICNDCHVFGKLVSKFFGRELVVRDANRFHHFKEGICSCGDFW